MSRPAETISKGIPDIMISQDTRHIPIDSVGIKGIRHPVVVSDRAGREQHTVAMFNMYVGLPHNFKGTHMSRFVEILNIHEYEITVESFKKMIVEMSEFLNAESGQIEMNFPYFVNKKAPVTGVESLMDYDVTFIGELHKGTPSTLVKVIVPVTTLCPCSKKRAYRYGFSFRELGTHSHVFRPPRISRQRYRKKDIFR